MTILFRVDASEDIGTGHVMRCLVLADQLRANGIKSHFVCRAHAGNMMGIIEDKGHTVSELSASKPGGLFADNDKFLGDSWEADAAAIVGLVGNKPISWIVVDHFSIDHRWEAWVKNALVGIKIMVIDGLANRPHQCDLLLDQTYSKKGISKWVGLLPDQCVLMVGPQYALLRPEFHAKNNISRVHSGELKRILVSFGGIDKPNATDVIVKAILSLTDVPVVVDVLLGAGNPSIARLRDRYVGNNKVKLHVQPANIANIMYDADLAITAGGTTVWELCASGVPMVIVSIADNQVQLAKDLDEYGNAIYLGGLVEQTGGFLKKQLKAFQEDGTLLITMSEKSKKLVSINHKSVCSYLIEAKE